MFRNDLSECGRQGGRHLRVVSSRFKESRESKTPRSGSAERIESCLAIDMVVAWRIYHLTKLGRETPNTSCTVFFEGAEWKALVAYKTQNPIPPEKLPTLREAIHMVASLGGFLGRKCDGETATQTLWLGLQINKMKIPIQFNHFSPLSLKNFLYFISSCNI